MEIINSTTIMVDNYSDLNSVVSANSDYTYVYLGADINMTSGIRIHPDRTLLVIDGKYPIEGDTIHTLTDTGGSSGMIYKDNISNLDFTFQNIIITGRNFYGMPRISDGNTNVTITYRNVTYTGPQITWHFGGTTRYIDCDITISYNGSSVMNEVAEARWVEIGGNTVIRHNNSAAFAVFYFYKTDASLTILEDANVEISTYYDFLYHEFPPSFTIQPRARLTLTTRRGISRNDGFRLSSFLVDEYAVFRYIQESDAEGSAALSIDGAFTVNKGAVVYMQADFQSSSSSKRIIRFTSSSGRGLYLNNPKSFVLYNRGPGLAMNFTSLTPFSFLGGQVNLWESAKLFPDGAGGFADLAPYRWYRGDWTTFLIRGNTINVTPPTLLGTVVEETTLTAEELEKLSPIESLQLHRAMVFSVGDLPLTIDPVIISLKCVTGKTAAAAQVMVVYNAEVYAHTVVCAADENGDFIAQTEDEDMRFGTAVTVSANTPFLISTLASAARYEEDLHIEAPETISFLASPISFNPAILPRKNEDPENPEPVVVTDVREVKTPWEIYVKLAAALQTEDGHTLNDAIVFAHETGEPETLFLEQEVYIYYSDELNEETPITWDEDKGVLVRITAPVRSGKRYSSQLIWEVRPVETPADGGADL